MSRTDPFNGTRLEEVGDYAKNFDLGKSNKKVSFYRVYDKTFGRYVYFVGRVTPMKYPVISIIAIYDRGDWYRIKTGNTFRNMAVDPRKITVKKAGPIVEKKLVYSLFQQNWIKHV